jgi:hypothetical protein
MLRQHNPSRICNGPGLSMMKVTPADKESWPAVLVCSLMSSEDPLIKDMVLRVIIWRWLESLRGGVWWEVMSSLGMCPRGNCQTPAPSVFSFACWYGDEWFAQLWTHNMMCCFATGPSDRTKELWTETSKNC